MGNKILKKIIIFVTVFMLVFSNCGYTLQALAATDGISLFGINLFGSGNIDFDVYFLDENGKKQTDNTANVNSQMTMVLELTPKAVGYLKSGTIKAVSGEEGEANFKFEDVFVENKEAADKEVSENLTISSQIETTLLQSELVLDPENVESEDENTVVPNATVDNTIDENTIVENTTVDNTIEQNIVTENTVENEPVIDSEENTIPAEEVVVPEEPTSEETIETIPAEEVEEEEFVDEEAALKEEKEDNFVLPSNIVADAKVIADDEIEIENIIENTKIYVNISFKTGENLNIEDLYKEVKLQLDGTYINVDLEEVSINLFETVSVAWEYTKDINVNSEYTKVSPFRIGDTEGTIVEDTITVTREITEDNYLPLKETKIEIEVPSLAGKTPTNLDVTALKLKATKGEDVNEVIFTKDNWTYNENKNTLTITVENTDGVFTYGEDIYVVTLRYDTYVSETEVSLATKGFVTVTEYSGKKNNEIKKDLDKNEKVVANVGELITYTISSKEDKIGKGRINANYNQAEERYEQEFDTTVNVNILTNDVLSEFTIKDSKEFYVDKEGLEFETTDVKYKKIKFRYAEIEEFLNQGGTIEIKTSAGELLYTLNKDLVNSDENAQVAILGDVRGVEVSFKNITVNGNIGIEFTKAIGKSSYEKAAFANFKKLESRVNGIVKYSNDSEGTELPEIKTEKEFEESKTEAEIEMNVVSLSTTELNENVEFKIVLNNEKEDSDLYVNPVFEIALPKYVSNIDLKAINMLYEAGLSVRNMTVYRADDQTLRMRIEVDGTQTEFSDGTIANGTNILVNANIEVDKYAPRKDEQVKLYYVNEGVTNYVSQTKWTLATDVPTGILKTTNGFDSYVFKINAPSGLITVNEIENYDGQGSKISSLKQGIEEVEIAREGAARVARMNLIAINNTENKCTDVAFLGRIPVKGATDVKTGEVLETNINTTLFSRIVENEENPLSAKIYYSSNPSADTNMNDLGNGWTENPESLESVKSFLIVPDNTVEPGYIFKYSYEFIIPENLPYESKIYGSFGGFYNNHSDVAVVYETSGADLVGLTTELGLKIDLNITVDIGDGASVGENQFLIYTLTAVNSGSVTADNVVVKNNIPLNTVLYTYTDENGYGQDNYVPSEMGTITLNYGTLVPGATQRFQYMVKVGERPALNTFYKNTVLKDELGYYYEVKDPISGENIKDDNGENKREYVDPNFEYYITNKATITASNLASEIESNETKNLLIDSNFDMQTNTEFKSPLKLGTNFKYLFSFKNTSGEDLHNVTYKCKLPDTVKFLEAEVIPYNHQGEFDYGNVSLDEETNTVTIKFAEIYKEENIVANLKVLVTSGNNEELHTYFSLITEDGKEEKSYILDRIYAGANLEISQITNVLNNSVKEKGEVQFLITVENKGNYVADKVTITDQVSEYLENVSIKVSGAVTDKAYLDNAHKLSYLISNLPADQKVTIMISGTAARLNGTEKTISNQAELDATDLDHMKTDMLNISIVENPDLKDETTNKNSNASTTQYSTKRNTTQTDNSNSDSSSNSNNNYYNNAENNSNNSNTNNNSNNNNNSNTNTNNNSYTNNNNTPTPSTPKATYKISGYVWADSNKNGRKDDDEKGVPKVEVQLFKNKAVLKATMTDALGKYTFDNLEDGKYTVNFIYDGNTYITTDYKKESVEEELNSDAIKYSDGNAVTNAITVAGLNIENVNLGLQLRDTFDLNVSKYLTKSVVRVKDKDTTKTYENVDLAKLDLDYRKLKDTTVELTYKIVIENTGNVDGKAIKVVDYLPKDMKIDLDNKQNAGWYVGNDANLYNESLKDINIAVGTKQELQLVLIKQMTEENTGTVVNKVEILQAESNSPAVEDSSNNTSTQETILSIKTGGRMVPLTVFTLIIICCTYLISANKVMISIENKRPKIKFNFKKVYK